MERNEQEGPVVELAALKEGLLEKNKLVKVDRLPILGSQEVHLWAISS